MESGWPTMGILTMFDDMGFSEAVCILQGVQGSILPASFCIYFLFQEQLDVMVYNSHHLWALDCSLCLICISLGSRQQSWDFSNGQKPMAHNMCHGARTKLLQKKQRGRNILKDFKTPF